MFVEELVELVLPPLPPPLPVSESSTAVPGTSSVIGLSPRATAGISAMKTSAAAAGRSRLPNELDMTSSQIEGFFRADQPRRAIRGLMQIAELHATRNFGGISARTSASLTRLNGQSARTRVTDQSIGSEEERSESWPGQVELFVSPATVK